MEDAKEVEYLLDLFTRKKLEVKHVVIEVSVDGFHHT
jgi:hypothetical protein